MKLQLMSHHMWCFCLEKATTHVTIHSICDIMEINPLILNKISVQWTADRVCTLHAEREVINVKAWANQMRSENPALNITDV